ncbi:MAG: translation initiation factor IF-3 [Candidatus Portnoybacteria bacterium]|nr:translation initiation factor IF-3 [Candidatus Portnoybacteria bacterium]
MRKQFFKKRRKKDFVRSNEQIRVPEVRVIDETGGNLGVLNTREAIAKAKEKGLDLIEVSAKANPPVCRITDYGKYQYDQEKKKKKQQSKQKKSELKGIRVGFKTSSHDMETKAKQADKFLQKGNKVRIEMFLKGREKAHRDLAREKLEDFLNMIPADFEKEKDIKKSPRGMEVIICQAKQKNQ